ncbi:MAG: helix-turn-helix transcriptional regulator [Oligoflexia bacterium]|nr:helix-turn-helix transcriptional regulator [Oligoflexia bacterium]
MGNEKHYHPPSHSIRDDGGMSIQLKIILKSLIKEHGISVAHLARTTKIPLQTIHGWLSGSEPKSFTQVKKVADYFEVSLDYLCFGATTTTHVPSPPPVGRTSATTTTATKSAKQEPIEQYSEEINAGIFEVVLRRVKR